MNHNIEKAKQEEKGIEGVSSWVFFFFFNFREEECSLFCSPSFILLANQCLLEAEKTLESILTLHRWETKIQRRCDFLKVIY